MSVGVCGAGFDFPISENTVILKVPVEVCHN